MSYTAVSHGCNKNHDIIFKAKATNTAKLYVSFHMCINTHSFNMLAVYIVQYELLVVLIKDRESISLKVSTLHLQLLSFCSINSSKVLKYYIVSHGLWCEALLLSTKILSPIVIYYLSLIISCFQITAAYAAIFPCRRQRFAQVLSECDWCSSLQIKKLWTTKYRMFLTGAMCSKLLSIF